MYLHSCMTSARAVEVDYTLLLCSLYCFHYFNYSYYDLQYIFLIEQLSVNTGELLESTIRMTSRPR